MVITGNRKTHADAMGPPILYDGTLEETGAFQGELGVFLTSGPKKTYDGATVVVPKAAQDIVLPTRERYVTDDITVRKVPSYRTDNLSGGKTVYIASE